MAIIPEDKDDSASAMTAALTRDPICAVLRKAREQAGYDIVDIAQLLRIQRTYLEAIEEGRYSDLPGTVYAIGFVRTYSDFLNLDATDMVRRFKEEALELTKRTDYVFPVPPAEARVPGMGILVVGVLLAALAYGAWYVSSSSEERLVDMASGIPDRFAELAARGGDEPQSGTSVPGPVSDSQMATDSGAEPAPAAPAGGSSNTPPDLDQLASIADPPAAAVPGRSDEETPVPAAPAPIVPIEVVEETPVAPAAPPVETAAPAVAVAAPVEPTPPAPRPAQRIEPIETVQNVESIRRVPPAAGGEAPAGQFEVAAAPPSFSSNGQPKANTGPSADGPINILPSARSTIATAPPPPPPAVEPGQTRRNGLGNLNSRIEIRATEMSWVQITDDLGNLVMTRVLDPGESYRVPNTAGLTLASGNAGGLQVVIDGVVQGPLGLRGTVVRNVTLDPDNFGVH